MRANFGRAFAVVAVMAEKFVIAAMKGERDVAIRAFERLAAGAAQYELRKAAAIEQDDDLFAAGVCFGNCFEQFW